MRKMKKIVLIIAMVCLAMCQTANANYSELLGRLQGSWYNPQGQVVLSFDNGYVNDCEILEIIPLSGGKYAGGYNFTIREGAGARTLGIFVHLSEGNGVGYGKYLILNNNDVRLTKR